MNTVKHLLSVLMDGIKDASMWLDYAKEAEDSGESTIANWFINHAKKRINELDSIYTDIDNVIQINDKAKSDGIAYALKCHLEEQIDSLKARIN